VEGNGRRGEEKSGKEENMQNKMIFI